MILEVVDVEVHADHILLVQFKNGERRSFDMTPYLDKGVFIELQDIRLFKLARVEYGTVAWPGEIDIAPEILYERSKPA